MTTALVQARGLVKGEQAGNVLERFFTLNLQGPLPRLEAAKSGEQRSNYPQPSPRFGQSAWSGDPGAVLVCLAGDHTGS